MTIDEWTKRMVAVFLEAEEYGEIEKAVRSVMMAAIEEEREACARLVELPTFIGLDDLAKAIRARKSKGN